MQYEYKTSGVCSQRIFFEVEGNTVKKILFGFTCEAYHNICCEGAVSKAFTKLICNTAVFLGVIVSVHTFKSAVTAALQRDMKLRAELFTLCKLRNHLICKVIGLERAEAYS